MTRKAPNSVFVVGISSQIKYPKIIANTKAKYFSGVTKLPSEYLYDCVSHRLANPPNMPIIESKLKSVKLGIIHP